MRQKVDKWDCGVPLDDLEQAFLELRSRASASIARNEHFDNDGRQKVIRLTDDTGAVLFQGTMEDATRAYPNVSANGVLISVCALQ